jgi:hypothetical protein
VTAETELAKDVIRLFAVEKAVTSCDDGSRALHEGHAGLFAGGMKFLEGPMQESMRSLGEAIRAVDKAKTKLEEQALKLKVSVEEQALTLKRGAEEQADEICSNGEDEEDEEDEDAD